MLIHSITARFRAIGMLAFFFGPALAGCALERGDDPDEATESVAQGLATDIVVYTDSSPASGWQSWSWSSTVSLASTDAPLASGSKSHIKTTVQSDGGALSLAHVSADLPASDYDSISFDVRAPSSSNVAFRLQTLAGGSSGAETTVAVTTSWTRHTVKLSSVQGSLASFGKIDWAATENGQTFYVDNVKVVAKTAATSTSSSFPSAPITVKKNDVVTLDSSKGPYSVYVPNSYDATHHTPTKVLLWLHGCGGNAYGDAWATSPGGTQSWIGVSVGGRDGGCWNPNTDVALAIAALDDVKRRLNVDPRRVVIGGYSSGGDMAYRTAFYNAKRFAGVIVENTSPFRDTGSTQSASLGAAAWKLNIVHLAHLSDTTYPIGPVRIETDAVKTAGFPITRIERPGTHWDADTTSSGTNYDMRTYLLRYIDAGWLAPL